MKTPQLLLQSGQLVTELSEFSAVSIVLGRAGLTRAGRLSARRLSRSRPRLRREVHGQSTNDCQRAECCDYPSHCILHNGGRCT